MGLFFPTLEYFNQFRQNELMTIQSEQLKNLQDVNVNVILLNQILAENK